MRVQNYTVRICTVQVHIRTPVCYNKTIFHTNRKKKIPIPKLIRIINHHVLVPRGSWLAVIIYETIFAVSRLHTRFTAVRIIIIIIFSIDGGAEGYLEGF